MPDPVNAGVFVPTLWARTALIALRANMGIAARVNRDYDPVIAQVGDTVKINNIPAITAQRKTRGSPVNFSAADPTGQNVVLNIHSVAPFAVDDIQKAQSSADLLREYGTRAAIAVAEDIEKELLAQWAFAAAAAGTAGTNLSKASLLAARNTLSTARAPANDPKFAFLAVKDYGDIVGDLSNTNASAQQDSAELREGKILRSVYGFTVQETQLAPVVAGAPNTTHGLAFHRDAIVFATRPLPAVNMEGIRSAVVIDPDLNVAMRVMMSFDHALMTHKVTYDLLGGIKVVRPELLVDLRS